MLLTDGSGLTSRQVAGRLHRLGHTVGVLSSDPLALARWTSSVSAWHRVPPFSADPLRWWGAARTVLQSHGYDVLLPTQEQVVAVSYAVAHGDLPARVATAVPSFEALERVQDKVSAARTLAELGVPQPAHSVLRSRTDVAAWSLFPAYVKTPIGTASMGVRRVHDGEQLATALESPVFADPFAVAPGVLVQEAVDAPLLMVQAVADRGRLVALHANRRVSEGPGGGATHKESVREPEVRRHVGTIVESLGWHGGLSVDVVMGPGPLVIDVNPRIVEPGNAWRSGVDLVEALLDVALGSSPDTVPDGIPGVRTHQLLLALLAAATAPDGRRAAWGEALSAVRGVGLYRGSSEELTPLGGDPLAAVPLVAALGLATMRPSWAGLLVGSSTTAYAAKPTTWARLTT